MNDSYIVINGKRAELTKEQLKTLGVEVRKNPFERCAAGEKYVTILGDDAIREFFDNNDLCDNGVYNAVNYFNNEQFARQVALHQLLYRKLLKFAYDNGCEDTAEWDCRNRHYHIIYSFNGKNLGFDSNDVFKQQGIVYFSSKDGVLQAIKEVVEPFMKKHPEFVW